MAGYRTIGRPGEAFALWERMRAAGVLPSPETYQHALVCAMRLKRHAVALDVWQLLDDDPSTTPGVIEYTVAISACELAGDPSRGLSLFDAMQRAGVAPDSNTMHVAVLAAGRRAGERPRPPGGRRQQRRQRVDASLVVEEAGLVLLPAA